VIPHRGLRILGDIASDQPQCIAFDTTIRLAQLALAGSQAFHFAAAQDDPAFDRIDDLVLMAGLAILTDDFQLWPGVLLPRLSRRLGTRRRLFPRLRFGFGWLGPGGGRVLFAQGINQLQNSAVAKLSVYVIPRLSVQSPVNGSPFGYNVVKIRNIIQDDISDSTRLRPESVEIGSRAKVLWPRRIQ
jgi:hypothetical protein